MNGYFSFPLLSYSLRSRTKNLIVWSFVSLCIFILIIVMFMNLLTAGLPDIISDMLSSLPTSLYGGTEGTGEVPDFTDFGVNFGLCMQLMLIVGCVYACYLGASSNSNSHGDSDITFIYAMPVSRLCTVLTSFITQFVTLFVYNIVVLLVSLAVLYSNNQMAYFGKILLAVFAFLLIETVYLSIAFLCSTFMNSSSQASSISAVTVTATLVFGLVGSLSSSLKVLTFLSPYTYVSVYSIVSGGSKVFFIGIVASVLIILVALAVSCIRYDKIDFLLD